MAGSWFYHISKTGTLSRVPTIAAGLAAAKEGGFVWLDYCQPTKEELLPLVDTFGVHPLSIEDCFDENQIPKIEDFPRNTFILFNTFDYSDRKLSISEIDLFLGEQFLVTVSRGGPDNGRLLQGIEHVVETDMDNARHGPAFLMHVILDQVVDKKSVAMEALEDDLNAVEEAVLADVSDFDPGWLVRLRRDLLNLRKSLFHEREILVKICRKDSPFVSDKAIFHYRDVYDHLAKFFELTESYRDLVTSLMEMYLTMLNNQMTKTANETNAAVRRLTLIATIFMPLTLLAGIGGMSEWSMITGPQNWPVSYPLFLLAMAVIALGNYYLLQRLEKRTHRDPLKAKVAV